MATPKSPLETVNRTRIPRPFVKWVGGKGQLLPKLRQFYPEKMGTYLEPFIGGGALYFDRLPPNAIISDINEELINAYRVVAHRVEMLIEQLRTHVYEKDHYYAVRAQDPQTLDTVARAARTLYLNRVGFNGLYRVNKKGQFNVPMGRYSKPLICDEKLLRGCSMALQRATITCAPFSSVIEHAQNGDFVYFDPPYIPVSQTANFTAYQKSEFGMDQQEQLARVFETLSRRGVYAILSNADVPWMHERYGAFHIHPIQARRSVNSQAGKRGPVGEVIVANFPILSKR